MLVRKHPFMKDIGKKESGYVGFVICRGYNVQKKLVEKSHVCIHTQTNETTNVCRTRL